jgi:hypothetical protein
MRSARASLNATFTPLVVDTPPPLRKPSRQPLPSGACADLLSELFDGFGVHRSVLVKSQFIATLRCLLLLHEPLDGSDQADNPIGIDDLHFDTDQPSPLGLQ